MTPLILILKCSSYTHTSPHNDAGDICCDDVDDDDGDDENHNDKEDDDDDDDDGDDDDDDDLLEYEANGESPHWPKRVNGADRAVPPPL